MPNQKRLKYKRKMFVERDRLPGESSLDYVRRWFATMRESPYMVIYNARAAHKTIDWRVSLSERARNIKPRSF